MVALLRHTLPHVFFFSSVAHSSSNHLHKITYHIVIMVFLSKSICFFTFIFLIKPGHWQQSYGRLICSTKFEVPGSNYLCTYKSFPCDIYIVYGTQKNFQTLSSIAPLFNFSLQNLLAINMTEAYSSNITVGQEIIIPINCSCPDHQFSQVIVMYNLSSSD